MNAQRTRKQKKAVKDLRAACEGLIEFAENNPADADIVLDGIRNGLRDLAYDDFFGTEPPEWLYGER